MAAGEPMQPDLEFLLKAANYGADRPGEFSDPARKAVDVLASTMGDVLELRRRVTTERLKLVKPEELAQEQHEAKASIWD